MNYQLFHLINADAGRWSWIGAVMRFAAADLLFVVFAFAAVIVGRALAQYRVRAVCGLAATLALAFVLSQILQHVSREKRPFQDHVVHQLIPHGPGISMPSDHATAAFAVAFGVLVFLHRRTGFLLTATAMVIGFSRVWVGVHYPGDILASAVIAALSALFVRVVTLGPPGFRPALEEERHSVNS